ncbi:MAG: hypothetical protein ACYCS7_10905 [Acidimicrobiales bacterium]
MNRPGEARARAQVEAAAKGSAEEVRIKGRAGANDPARGPSRTARTNEQAGATEPVLAQTETVPTNGSAVGTDRAEVIERVEVGVIERVEVGVIERPRARPGGNTRLPWCARGGGVWLARGPG